jgi:hypothetical protein
MARAVYKLVYTNPLVFDRPCKQSYNRTMLIIINIEDIISDCFWPDKFMSSAGTPPIASVGDQDAHHSYFVHA